MKIPENLSLNEETFGIAPYIVTDSLQKAIEYAYLLKRPLFLRGEPGCGKTQFARVLAFKMYGEKYKEKYFEWFIKSTSKAVDGLYRFDYLKRLRDAQQNELKEAKDYLTKGEMGKAFEASKKGAPSILLIDEIDKADIDFPNDLLLELDQKRFTIPELNDEEIKADEAPIVIITSNDERELPNAFLRRCVFCYIYFPTGPILETIVKAHIKNYVENTDPFNEQVKNIVGEFERIYTNMKNNQNKDKVVSTSELLDWTKVIYEHYKKDGNKLVGDKIPLISPGDPKDSKEKGMVKINYPEVLFKTLNDFNLFHARPATELDIF